MYRWKPYVSVAQRKEKAIRKIGKLKKQGLVAEPINGNMGRKITKTFWGNAWAKHIELFSDYDNRLPRGRTYVRNGSVFHLAITKSNVTALVAGSEIYEVNIKINTLSNNKWNLIKTKCTGEIGSLLELLSGNLSNKVMEAVCNSKEGLFPLDDEIKLQCTCPDWAVMCKHVAAVLYGIAARLDNEPKQLFILRGVNIEELIDVKKIISNVTETKQDISKYISNNNLSDIFNIELTDKNTKPKPKPKPKKRMKAIAVEKKLPVYLTGVSIKRKRRELLLTQVELAKQIGCSASLISRWESRNRKRLSIDEKILQAIYRIW